jgi:DNA-binding NarL/FixJ family response regulator
VLFRTLGARPPREDPQSRLQMLTSRERQVLQLIDGGLSNKEIATALGIEVSTVKNHVHNLLDKLRVPSRMQAAAWLGTHLTSRQRSQAAPLEPRRV